MWLFRELWNCVRLNFSIWYLSKSVFFIRIDALKFFHFHYIFRFSVYKIHDNFFLSETANSLDLVALWAMWSCIQDLKKVDKSCYSASWRKFFLCILHSASLIMRPSGLTCMMSTFLVPRIMITFCRFYLYTISAGSFPIDSVTSSSLLGFAWYRFFHLLYIYDLSTPSRNHFKFI